MSGSAPEVVDGLNLTRVSPHTATSAAALNRHFIDGSSRLHPARSLDIYKATGRGASFDPLRNSFFPTERERDSAIFA